MWIPGQNERYFLYPQHCTCQREHYVNGKCNTALKYNSRYMTVHTAVDLGACLTRQKTP